MDSDGPPVGAQHEGAMPSPDKALFGYLMPLFSRFISAYGVYIFWGGLAAAIVLYNVWDSVLDKYYSAKMVLFPGPKGVPRERLSEVEAERRRVRDAQQKRLEADAAEAAVRRAEAAARRREERLAETHGTAAKGQTLGGGPGGSGGGGAASGSGSGRLKAVKGLSQRTFAQMRDQDPEWNSRSGPSGYRPSTIRPSGGG